MECGVCGSVYPSIRLAEGGRKAAVHPGPIPYKAHPEGDRVLITTEGDVVRCVPIHLKDADGIGYLEHKHKEALHVLD